MPECNHCPRLRRAAGGIELGGQVSILPWCGTDEWPAVVNAVITGGPAPGTYPITLVTDPDDYWFDWWRNDTIDLGSIEGTGIVVDWVPAFPAPISGISYPMNPTFNPDETLTFPTSLTCHPFRLTFELEGIFAGITVAIEMP